MYIFYIILALVWLLIELFENRSLGTVGYILLGSIATFCLQVYYKIRVVNLILGILLLPVSILGALQFLSWGGKSGFDAFIFTALILCITSIACSILLVFSYLKLSFSED